ncbi:efflux RND transporter periplasmic adaptor subunit [Synechococcus sp. Tobar12-5m-g]|uniref:efflux RND transporter periplasmic adaptor subunit n=1 Tax=unclassified Synechococcus TaxID=2626047 RepID=UPI0020CCC0A8|nr:MULTISPECIES: efflux RND transporter periplasmic adaptor subunit [unclassified Synechococcus]MCP9772684.1 efflux RND transporter periplasmic adaptor subunit [Synechococcus sp. Tobar12-5m-g]MCP9873460.1 efflux RND transporter periplasmic adaptor subunit [Synechococcus sp. Cruz CV-v-12]
MTSPLRHPIPVLAASSLLALVSLPACAPAPPPVQPPVAVRLVNPRTLPFVDSADYQSTLEAIREVKLAAEISGRIVAMPMTEGQAVRPGQLLFTLDQVQQQAATDSAAAEARKDIINAERYVFLNDQGAVSTKERDFYITQAIQSRDTFKASKATLGYKDVNAPIAGFIGTINVKLGDVVNAGTPVTSVVDNSRLWVRLDVAGEDAYRVKRGLPVLLRAPDRSELVARGVVSFVAPSLDKQRQTLLVKATFSNADGALRNNQRVNATLVFAQGRLLAIPQQAVLLQAGKTFVFLAVSPQDARQRLGREIEPPPPPGSLVAVQVSVSLGTLQNGVYPLKSGLQSTDSVILANLAQLRSGLAVRQAPSRP